MYTCFVVVSWQNVIDACIIKKSAAIREVAIYALAAVCQTYYIKRTNNESNSLLVRRYLSECNNDLEECMRMGYVSALGVLPTFMLAPCLDDTVSTLIRYSLKHNELTVGQVAQSPLTQNWAEARRDSVKALCNVAQTFGGELDGEYFDRIFDCMLKSLQEYTLDDRGDIGAWVREASMTGML